jgi:arginine decarboxylase
MIPKQFFVTSGKAISEVTELNAFDRALMNAGLGEQNLVTVSSVLPEGIKQVQRQKLPRGSIINCVLAQMRGSEGETICAGIAYAFREDGKGGYVAEGHGYTNARVMREILKWKLEEMAKLREIDLLRAKYKVEDISIPWDNYGACVVALVFLP